MTLVGYARSSSIGLSLDMQVSALDAAGCDKVFVDADGRIAAGTRSALNDAVDYTRDGDTLVVTGLDRVARTASDLHAIIAGLAGKGVQFRCLQQSSVDTSADTDAAMLDLLAAVAEFETNVRRERQRDGIERAKRAGVYKGRKSSIDRAAIRELHQQGVRPVEIARRLGIGRATVYRALADPT